MFRPTLALLSLLLPLLPWATAFPDESSVVIPPETKLVVQIDLATFRKTALGNRFLKLTEKLAAEEIGEDGENVMANVKTALGFDPLTEIQSISVMWSNFEDPETDVHVVVKLGKTAENLQGFVLSLPLMLSLSEYRAVKHGEHTIHCATDKDFAGCIAIYTDKQQAKWVLGSSEADSVRVILDGLSSGADTKDATPRVAAEIADGNFAKIHILEPPADVLDLGDEIADIAKELKEVYVSFKEDSDSIVVSGHVTADNPIQADLTLGLMEFLITMASVETSKEALEAAKEAAKTSRTAQEAYEAAFDVFKSALEASSETAEEGSGAFIEAYLKAFPTGDADTRLTLELLRNTTVSRDGNEVFLRTSVPTSLLAEFLKNEVDLPL